jgi:hypothetical protein
MNSVSHIGRLFVASCLLVAFAASAKPLKVEYAGIAFVGDAASAGSYRYTRQLLEEKEPGSGRPRLEVELARRVAAVRNPSFELSSGGNANLRKGESLALAFAVEWENVAKERAGDLRKTVVDVHAQLLVFDFSEMKILSAYPIGVQIVDVTDKEVTEERILTLVREVFYGGGKANILDRFTERLATVSLKLAYGHRLRVASVVIDEAAYATVRSVGGDPAGLAHFVANAFGQYLSENMKVSVLPYSKGTAIGQKMTARFVNSEIYDLAIPEADYVVNLRVRGFKKVKLQETPAETAWGYGSYVGVTIEQPDLAKRYLDNEFKFALLKRVPASITQMDDWSAYQEATRSLFDQLTRQFAAPSRDWAKKWADGADAVTRLADAGKVVGRCK